VSGVDSPGSVPGPPQCQRSQQCTSSADVYSEADFEVFRPVGDNEPIAYWVTVVITTENRLL